MTTLQSPLRFRLVELAIAGAVVVGVGLLPCVPAREVRLERPVPRLEDAPDRQGVLAVALADEAGRALSGARVRVFVLEDGRALLAGEAVTRAGEVEIGHLPSGELWVLADADGYARATSHLVLAEPRRELRLVTRPEATLDVVVQDDEARPVVDATIEVDQGEPVPIGARTDARGFARVGRLGRGPWTVLARAPGLEESSSHASKSGDTVRLRLRKLGAFVVRVEAADGAPVGGADVLLATASLAGPRLARTEDDGTVRVGGLTAGSYSLRARRESSVSPIEVGLTLERGEEKEVTLRLAPGAFVGVRVVDGEEADAEPVASARVSIAEAGLSPFPFEGVAAKDGRVRLGPMTLGPVMVTAAADGYVPRSVPAEAGAAGEVRVPLLRGGILVGRLRDGRGNPVDGAMLEVIGTDFFGGPIADDPRRMQVQSAHFAAALGPPKPLVASGELGVMPGPVPPIPRSSFAASFGSVGAGGGATAASPSFVGGEAWVSRGDGTFRLQPVTPGRVRVVAHHPQYVDALSAVVTVRSGQEQEVDIVLRAGGTVEGRVVDGRGRPVEGVRVFLAGLRTAFERTTRSAQDGTFAFVAVPEQVEVSLSTDEDAGRVRARSTLTIPEGERRSITLTLDEARPPLPVKIVEPRGMPVRTAQVRATSLDANAPLRVTSFTDEQGEARVPSARGIHVRLDVTAPGFAPKSITVGPEAESARVELDEGITVRGLVRNTRPGDPIAGALVTLFADDGPKTTRTGRTGEFTLSDLAPGEIRLRVRAAGYAALVRPVRIDDGRRDRAQRLDVFELVPEAVVEGTVVDGRGVPVPGARVAKDAAPTYLAPGAPPPDVAIADGKGRFRLGSLPEGETTLEAFAPEHGRARVVVRLRSDRPTEGVRIVLPHEGRGGADLSPGSVAVTLGETSDPKQVVVVAVQEGSEAERAGLVPGDVILEVDGTKVETLEEARTRLSGPLSSDVLVALQRGEQRRGLRVPREAVRK